MSDDKKRDDFKIDIAGGKEFTARAPSPVMRSSSRPASITENPTLSILAYCGSSILMTVMNKYVLSGVDFNLNFFLLCVQVHHLRACNRIPLNLLQSVVCIVAIQSCKSAGIISYRDFNSDEAKKCRCLQRALYLLSGLTCRQGSPSPCC